MRKSKRFQLISQISNLTASCYIFDQRRNGRGFRPRLALFLLRFHLSPLSLDLINTNPLPNGFELVVSTFNSKAKREG